MCRFDVRAGDGLARPHLKCGGALRASDALRALELRLNRLPLLFLDTEEGVDDVWIEVLTAAALYFFSGPREALGLFVRPSGGDHIKSVHDREHTHGVRFNLALHKTLNTYKPRVL